MIHRCVTWCGRHSRTVILLAVVAAIWGEHARRRLSRDAVPDPSDPQVGLVAQWMGHPAGQVAATVTSVVTESLKSVPGVTSVRGASMAGMAYVDVLFRSIRDLEPGRREIARRVDDLKTKLPATIRMEVGPPASSTGWIYEYALVGSSRLPLAVGHRVQDELLRRELEKIPGVAEVASVGGTTEQLIIESDAEQLRARNLAFSDVVESVRAGVHGNPDPWKIDTLPLLLANHSKRLVGDVGHTKLTEDMPIGITDLAGDPQVAGGIVIAKRGADPKAVIAAVERTLGEASHHLPRNIKLVTIYNRMDLANRVERTLLTALAEEVAVVVLVILMFLLHGRSALAPALTLPLVVLITFGGMYLFGVSATIMSVGGIGIALGMAVDADVVALEACHRRLESLPTGATPDQRRAAVTGAAGGIVPAILTSLLITALSFLPVFAFTGETGRLLRPLAFTKTLVIIAAAIVAVTVAPALRDRLLQGRIVPEFDNPITRTLVRLYRPFVTFALARPALTLATAVLAMASCFPIMSRLGGEFLPRVDEGDLLFMPTTLPGVSPGDAGVQLTRIDKVVAQFPEVAQVFGKVGRANTATDPAPFSMAEVTIRLRPRTEWPAVFHARWYSSWAPNGLKRTFRLLWPEEKPETTAELVDKLDRATRTPGWASAWSAPARARMDMMSTAGVRTPVGIRIVAASAERLEALGAALQKRVAQTPHARSVVFESLGGEPWLQFQLDPSAAQQFHVDAALAQSTADFVISGGQVNELTWQGAGGTAFRPKRFIIEHGHHPGETGIAPDKQQPYRLRIVPDMSMKPVDADLLREITLRAKTGQVVPLGLVGHPVYRTVPATIRTENGEMVAYVYVDLDSATDVASYVKAARQEVNSAIARGDIHAPARRAHRVDRATRAHGRRATAVDVDRATGGAFDVCPSVPAVQERHRGADRADFGAIRAGGQPLDAVLASLPDVRARLGRPVVDGRPGHADRRRDGGLHRRGVPAAGARRSAAHARRHHRSARGRYGSTAAAQGHDHCHHGHRLVTAAVGRRLGRRNHEARCRPHVRRADYQRVPHARGHPGALHDLARPSASCGTKSRGARRSGSSAEHPAAARDGPGRERQRRKPRLSS